MKVEKSGRARSKVEVQHPNGTEHRSLKAKLGTEGWRDVGRSQEDPARLELMRRLRQRMLDTNIICLIGSGVSRGVGGPSMGDFWTLANAHANFEYALKTSGHSSDVEDIEAFLSRCRMAQQFNGADEQLDSFVTKVQEDITAKCREFLTPETPLSSHCSFLHRLARRSLDSSRTMVFTTNYDLCIEQAAGQSGLPIIDGFTLTEPQYFDGRNYDLDYVRRVPNQREPSYVEGVFHLYKLHGSVNWREHSGEIVRDPTAKRGVMIFPRDTKYQLSYQHPFLEMMARFQFALRMPNTTLFALGFGFNDDHLSEPILAALRGNPQFNLVVATRSLLESSMGAKPNRCLQALSDLAGASGLESVTLIDSTFDDFVSLLPNAGTQTDEQRFTEIARRILLPKLAE